MSPTTACPHLGVPSDSKLRYSYANPLHVCFAGDSGPLPFTPLDVTTQQAICLATGYTECSTYLSAAAHASHFGRAVPANRHLSFFGLKEEPFSIVPRSHFLCETEQQQEARAGLRWLIDCHHGLGLLYGPVGTGKTLLCHTLFEELSQDRRYHPALMLTPSDRSEYALMSELLTQWRVRPERLRSTRSLETVAHDYVLQMALGRRRTPVLIIDEAQNLSTPTLLQVCKMLNWQDGGQQLLQVVLAGQLSLGGRLARVPALRDRAVVEFSLSGMTQQETRRMIAQRVKAAGGRSDLFAPGAPELIHKQTGGMPRRAIILCLKSLWLAYYDGERRITAGLVQSLIDEAGPTGLYALPEAPASLGHETQHATEGLSARRRLRSLFRLWRADSDR